MMETARKLFEARHTVVPFVWLFCVTILIKIDNQEGFYPLFRVCVFALLPFALFHLCRSALRMRLDGHRWLELQCVVYIAIYPIVTMLFTPLNTRNLKDAAYTLGIFAILVFLARRYFSMREGRLDVPSVGRFWVVFASVQCAIAMLFWLGLEVDFGARLDFSQKAWLDGRLHGLVGTSSHLAPFIAIASLFLLAQPATLSRTLTLGFLFSGLVMTGSRSALIGFFVAGSVIAFVWLSRLRLPTRKIYQLLVVAVCLVGAAVYFRDYATGIVEMAVRIDPPGWQKSRSVMWERRLIEFSDRSLLTQIFGAGHRSQSQTFNTNIEFLVNYGLIYMIVFNAVYLSIVARALIRAIRHPDVSNVFTVMVAIFVYLFSQGLNPIFSAFVMAIQFAIVFVALRHFERVTVPDVIQNPALARAQQAPVVPSVPALTPSRAATRLV